MTQPVPEEFLDERYHELARLRQRADRAESAVSRVLQILDRADSSSVPVTAVRRAITGPTR